ncbi:basic helix-loop-helix (bHLH) DNA-binding superfamily protein [Thalictrum thalictroides]|uniref:Basic helix-loop-helix (BHLH) DNA-binding superfamily protein n=1 Tax=Thalictrum thalictroides TaxID=46969 RepID=A0A7J6WFR8_THATH|nr:basic helix-loop-helix (bHLH) DNA-binding superfamily protein [Thalictrum thalictroides]
MAVVLGNQLGKLLAASVTRSIQWSYAIFWSPSTKQEEGKTFGRSLLAKSASIQTVVCFAVSGGVVELGVTNMVMEDLNLLQQMKSFFLDFQKHSCAEKFISSPPSDEDDESLACDSDHHDADNTQKNMKSGLRSVSDTCYPRT